MKYIMAFTIGILLLLLLMSSCSFIKGIFNGPSKIPGQDTVLANYRDSVDNAWANATTYTADSAYFSALLFRSAYFSSFDAARGTDQMTKVYNQLEADILLYQKHGTLTSQERNVLAGDIDALINAAIISEQHY